MAKFEVYYEDGKKFWVLADNADDALARFISSKGFHNLDHLMTAYDGKQSFAISVYRRDEPPGHSTDDFC